MRSDLPTNTFLRRDVRLLETFYGAARVFWDGRGRWMRVNGWTLPKGRWRYNHPTTDILIMVPGAYGELGGQGGGLEEFYIRPDLRLLRDTTWQELPHSYAGVDRRSGEALAAGWRYLCVHTEWNPRRDTVMTAMMQLGLVFADPWAFERLANRNGSAHV